MIDLALSIRQTALGVCFLRLVLFSALIKLFPAVSQFGFCLGKFPFLLGNRILCALDLGLSTCNLGCRRGKLCLRGTELRLCRYNLLFAGSELRFCFLLCLSKGLLPCFQFLNSCFPLMLLLFKLLFYRSYTLCKISFFLLEICFFQFQLFLPV